MAAAPEVGIAQEARKRLAGMAKRVGHPANRPSNDQATNQRPYELPAGIGIPQWIIERIGVGMLHPRQRKQSRERIHLREAARGGVVPARAQVL